MSYMNKLLDLLNKRRQKNNHNWNLEDISTSESI
jgi:hypothetical protein